MSAPCEFSSARRTSVGRGAGGCGPEARMRRSDPARKSAAHRWPAVPRGRSFACGWARPAQVAVLAAHAFARFLTRGGMHLCRPSGRDGGHVVIGEWCADGGGTGTGAARGRRRPCSLAGVPCPPKPATNAVPRAHVLCGHAVRGATLRVPWPNAIHVPAWPTRLMSSRPTSRRLAASDGRGAGPSLRTEKRAALE